MIAIVRKNELESFYFEIREGLGEKYPHIEISFFISRKRRYVHMGLEKVLLSYSEHSKIIEDIENFWKRNEQKGFELLKPPILVKTVKWKFDYLLFRKIYDSV